jgi:DNA-binding NarL/FixJ family response regulator
MASPNRILVVDDHAAVRHAVRHVLDSHPDFEVCGEAENGRVAIAMAERLRPDMIVLDLSMPVMNGLEAAKVLHTMMPETPILMYTSFANENLPQEALAAGVSKVAMKSSPPALIKDLQMLIKPQN